MPRPRRQAPRALPSRTLWAKPETEADRSKPRPEADLVRAFRTKTRTLPPGDWIAYHLSPEPGWGQAINRPPVLRERSVSILAHRPQNGLAPMLFLPLTETTALNDIKEHWPNIDAVRTWFFTEFPPVSHLARLKREVLWVHRQGMTPGKIAHELNRVAADSIRLEVQWSKPDAPCPAFVSLARYVTHDPLRVHPGDLPEWLRLFGYGQKAGAIIADAIRTARSGKPPFAADSPFPRERVRDYLRRWQPGSSPSAR